MILAAATAAFALTAAPATTASDQSADSTTDSCEMRGTATFSGSGLGNEPQHLRYGFDAAGTCDGTLNGGPIEDEPVETSLSGEDTLSCLVSAATNDAHGTMRFTRGTRRRSDDVLIDFIVGPLVGGGTENTFRVRGRVAGEAVGHSSFLNTAPPDASQRCADGTLKQIDFEVTVRTLTPIVG